MRAELSSRVEGRRCAVILGIGAIIAGNNPFEAAADGIFGGAVGSLFGWGTGSGFRPAKCFVLCLASAGAARHVNATLHPEAGSGIASSIGAAIDSLFGDAWDDVASHSSALSDEDACSDGSCMNGSY